MTIDHTHKGPGFSLSQRIGDVARSALHANKPDNWVLNELGGDDFGYDFQAYAFHETLGGQFIFNIQLKGTTQSNARLADGENLTFPFNVSTLKLWHKSSVAVLVIIVDLIETMDQKLATVHYNFVSEELEETLSQLPSDQQTLNIHVPTNQLVHKNLDILPIIQPYLIEMAELRRALREQRRSDGAATPGYLSIGTTESSAENLLGQTFLSEQIEKLIDGSPRKTNLNAALSALRTGDYSQVLQLCPDPSRELCQDAPKDAAIIAHLRSLALGLIGESDAADILTILAESLLPDCDDITAAAAQIKLNSIGYSDAGQESRNELLKSLKSHNGICVTSIKCKILALDGSFDEARNLLESFPTDKAANTKIIVSTIEKNWERVLAEILEARAQPMLKPKSILLFDMFEARARFEIAFKNAPRSSEGDFYIPSTGLPNLDYESLKLSFDIGLRAMQSAQRLNWPSDIQYIIDILPSSAMILGRSSESLPLLTSLGIARPMITSIREVVSKMAVQLDQPEIALQLHNLATSLPQFENEASVMAVATLNTGNISKGLEFVTDDFLANPSSKDVYLSSLLMLGMAANSTLRTDLLEKIKHRLSLDNISLHYLAILDSAIRVHKNNLQRFEAVKILFDYWSNNNQPTTVGYHLLINLDTRFRDEAEIFIVVATAIEVNNSLGNEHLILYGQAFLTLNRYDEAVSLLKPSLSRFPDDPRVQSLLGMSLELCGNSPEAFVIFDQLLMGGKASDDARNYYVDIAMRMGFFERAEQQIRNAFSNTNKNYQKLRLINTLFQLLIAEGKRPQQIEETAWEYGRLADQNNEEEEGCFLQQYLFATQRDDISINSTHIDEFRKRLEAYFEKFPSSKVLWRAQLPIDGPPEELLPALLQAVGINQKDIDAGNAIERKMDQGALQVPFSWRPRKFLRNISDVFMLWELRRKVSIDKAAMHFSSSLAGYNRLSPENLNTYEVVLSLTSILLLEELALLELVLDTFPKIVIARATLAELQKSNNSFTAGWGHIKASRIVEQLQKHFLKISHPSYVQETPKLAAISWHQEEVNAMQVSDRIYFSDDIIETYVVCNTDDKSNPKPSISTVDFLSWADEEREIVTPLCVAEAIGKMIHLRINSITIKQRYLFAAIPKELNLATSQRQAEIAMQNETTLPLILDGVWNHFKPFKELRDHFAINMAYLINEGQANEEVLVYLWGRWIKAVRFQDKPNIRLEQKVTIAFIATLHALVSDQEKIHMLWSAFWMVFKRDLQDLLDKPEDQFCIQLVGGFLGGLRADTSKEQLAMDLFEKAKLGLTSGSHQADLLNNEYVDALVKFARGQFKG